MTQNAITIAKSQSKFRAIRSERLNLRIEILLQRKSHLKAFREVMPCQ